MAEKILKARLRELGGDVIDARTFTTPKASRLTTHDLLEALRADLQLRGKDSRCLAVGLNSEKIDAYKKEWR